MNAPPKTDKANKVTPMMAQFLAIKAEVGPEALLFYRMGGFYEMFFDDAVKAAAALDIALTKRGKHQGADIPMCGVPVHASETYLQRLIKKGFRVAVCEQTESPAEAKKRGSKSVVRREVVRLVTPGTLTEDSLLDSRGRNLILALSKTLAGDYGLAWADISEGEFQVCAVEPDSVPAQISALAPRELVLPEDIYFDGEAMAVLPLDGIALTPQPKIKFDAKSGSRRLQDRFALASLEGLGDFTKAELSAAGALLDYLELTQAGNPVQLSPPRQMQAAGFLAIDPATRASLEISRTQSGSRKGSLLAAIDHTVTGPGARLLSDHVSRPLMNVAEIKSRHDAVDFFVTQSDFRAILQEHLKACADMARAMSRLALDRGGPRDLRVIHDALNQGQAICAAFMKAGVKEIPDHISGALDDLSLADKPDLAILSRDIGKAIMETCPLMARDGGFVTQGWRADMDALKALRDDSRKIVASLQAQYAETASVPTLKIKHNNVLGYFIEVSPKYADTMLSKGPESIFIHRQTLVSGVRFTTTELAELDSKISSAGDKVLALELEVFAEFVSRARDLAGPIRRAAKALALLDVQCGWADWAAEVGAVRPEMTEGPELRIEHGRHPVVELALKKSGSAGFTANDCALDASGNAGARLALITGPNMAGKSTYLRQNALMFILAQSGGFVPAKAAKIGVADRLFSRVGASDDLSKGRSTFMVEMIETASILNQATARSFVILDEIGRGTSTFDGLAIAWATAEHLHGINSCRALFATHYHEMTALIDELPAARNASLKAKEWNGDLVFLHDVRDGPADKSYGIQVAKLAGLPRAAVDRARTVLAKLEEEGGHANVGVASLPLFSAPSEPAPAKPSAIDEAIKALNVDDLSPRQALDLLYDLKTKSDQAGR